MRKVTVVSSLLSNNLELNGSWTTWGELRTVLNQNGMDTNNMKAMVRETKNNLDSEGAILPTTDFILILTAAKVKSGN
jgi:hypothetical protein